MGISIIQLFYLALATLLISACSDITKAPAVDQSAGVEAPKPAKQIKPPANSDAIQTAKPLGVIKGSLSPLNTDLYTAAQFADAIEYAKNLDSYSLLIWHKGALRLEQYYDSFDAELRAETASMHKSVLGLLIACAIEDGFIGDVDARIGDFIEAWKDMPEGDITIRQLLTMSSGLNSLSFVGGFNSDAMKFNTGRLDARATILGLRLNKKPGTSFSYANTSSQILALVLEAAAGQAYAEYLSQRLWQPLGADDASVWYFEENGFPRTFASLLARSRDWVKVGLLYKDQGKYRNKQIISSELIAAMTSPSKTNPNYGWHVWLGNEHQPLRHYNDLKVGIAVPVSQAFAADDIIYFDGFGGQRVYISKSQDLVIVRTGDTRMDWDDSALPNMVIESLIDQ